VIEKLGRGVAGVYDGLVQTAKTASAMVRTSPFLSMVPIISGLCIGGLRDPVW